MGNTLVKLCNQNLNIIERNQPNPKLQTKFEYIHATQKIQSHYNAYCRTSRVEFSVEAKDRFNIGEMYGRNQLSNQVKYKAAGDNPDMLIITPRIKNNKSKTHRSILKLKALKEDYDDANQNTNQSSKLKYSNSSKKKLKNMSNPTGMSQQMLMQKLNSSKLQFNNEFNVNNLNTDRSLFNQVDDIQDNEHELFFSVEKQGSDQKSKHCSSVKKSLPKFSIPLQELSATQLNEKENQQIEKLLLDYEKQKNSSMYIEFDNIESTMKSEKKINKINLLANKINNQLINDTSRNIQLNLDNY